MNAKWITPVVTAFDAEGHVDLEANKRIYEHLIQGGMDGILILGSIGEFFAISMEEKKKLIDTAVSYIDKRVTLYVGTNCMILKDCIELSNYAIEKGADAVMVISPYYFNLPHDSIINFYDQVADNVNGPVLLYNFPDRTGYDLSPQLILELVRKHKNIVGIKDTVGTMGHTREIIQVVKKEFPDFQVYSGFDEFFAHNVLSGGNGCVAGISNFVPRIASAFADAAREDNLLKMAECQQKIDSLMEIYSIGEQFIPIIKEAMVQTGVEFNPVCAQPLLCATEEQKAKIANLLKSQEITGIL